MVRTMIFYSQFVDAAIMSIHCLRPFNPVIRAGIIQLSANTLCYQNTGPGDLSMKTSNMAHKRLYIVCCVM